MWKLITLFTLITLTISIKVHCQGHPSKWSANTQYKLNQREVLVPTIYDMDVFVDGYDGDVSRIIRSMGYWQPRILRNMGRFVQPGYTIMNIGSHIGLQAVVLGKGLGPNGKLYMFQPFSVSHNLALKNVYFHGLADITTIFNAGAASLYSKATQVINLGNTGASRVYLNPVGNNGNNQQVIVDQIDNMLPKDAIINFALIDTERMELEVFNGMKQTILRSPNIIILCEWSGAYFKGTGEAKKMQDVLNWFKQNNFKFYQMSYGQQACTYARWAQQTMQQVMDKQTYPDILFVPSHIDPNKVGV